MNRAPSDLQVRKLATDIRRSLILSAPAGSGKTSILELRYMRALAHSDSPEQVLAITFTLAAAGEIRERVYGTLAKVQDGARPGSPHESELFAEAAQVLKANEARGWGLMEDPSRMRIMTIDALNSLIASTLPLVSRSGGALDVEQNPTLLYRDAVLSLLAELEDPGSPESLKEALGTLLSFGRHQFDRLIPMLESLLAARDQWLQPLLNHSLEDFESTLAAIVQSSIDEACRTIGPEQWTRVAGLLKDASGFDSKVAWAADLDPGAPMGQTPCHLLRCVAELLLTQENKLRKRVDKRLGFSPGNPHKEGVQAFLEDLHEGDKAGIERALGVLRVVPDPSFGDDGAEMLKAFRVALLSLAAQLQITFQNHGKVDFIEVHGRAMAAMGSEDEGHGEFLIREERIQHILVDEMQDTSGAQIRLLLRLISEWSDGDGRSIFMCGDPQQSIYGFRGAEVGQFLKIWLSGAFGPKQLERHALTNNFRSAPQLVSFYNNVFTSLFGDQDNPWTGRVPFSKAQAFRSDLKGSVEVQPYFHDEGDEAEAQLVCDYLERELKADPNAEIAVLVRSRSHLKSLLPLMHERRIPAAGEDIDQLTDKAAVGDLVGLIRALIHPGDRTAWTILLRSPLVGLTWADCLRLLGSARKAYVRDLLEDSSRLMALSADGKQRALRLLCVLRRIEASERWCDVEWRCSCLWHSLGGAEVVDSHTLDEIRTVFKVLADCAVGGQLSSLTEFEHKLSGLYAAPKPGAVKLMTIHNAKGLQFDKVCLVGLNKSTPSDTPPLLYWKCIGQEFLLVPKPAESNSSLSGAYSYLGSIRRESAKNELMRLLYVAATRAVTKLTIFAGLHRSVDGEPYASNGTFMHLLLPFVREDCETIQSLPEHQTSSAGHLVSVPRVPSSYKGPEVDLSAVLKAGRHGLPTEAITGSGGHEDRSTAQQRASGIVYHFIMERVAKEGLARWPAGRLEQSQKALIALLRRHGCPDGELAAASLTVMSWATRTVTSPVGRWLLSAREQSWAEYKISGKRSGRWFSDIMDLVFIEEGVVWVVDYKSSANRTLTTQQIVHRHREQLQRYKGTLSKRFPGMLVRPVVFNPETQELIDVDSARLAA